MEQLADKARKISPAHQTVNSKTVNMTFDIYSCII